MPAVGVLDGPAVGVPGAPVVGIADGPALGVLDGSAVGVPTRVASGDGAISPESTNGAKSVNASGSS
ncbi:MAG: hypothetical protein ACK2T6_00925 [Anaerolineae bacterium]